MWQERNVKMWVIYGRGAHRMGRGELSHWGELLGVSCKELGHPLPCG